MAFLRVAFQAIFLSLKEAENSKMKDHIHSGFCRRASNQPEAKSGNVSITSCMTGSIAQALPMQTPSSFQFRKNREVINASVDTNIAK